MVNEIGTINTSIIWQALILAVLFTLSVALPKGKNKTITIIKYVCLGLLIFLAFLWIFGFLIGEVVY